VRNRLKSKCSTSGTPIAFSLHRTFCRLLPRKRNIFGHGGDEMGTFDVAGSRDVSEETEGSVSSETPQYGGLCSTCKNVSTCTYPRDPERPIFYCCEHEGYEECEGSVSLALLRTGKVFSDQPESMVVNVDSTSFKGLCRNCQNRDTCTFPKPEGGVWHCEEYR